MGGGGEGGGGRDRGKAIISVTYVQDQKQGRERGWRVRGCGYHSNEIGILYIRPEIEDVREGRLSF